MALALDNIIQGWPLFSIAFWSCRSPFSSRTLPLKQYQKFIRQISSRLIRYMISSSVSYVHWNTMPPLLVSKDSHSNSIVPIRERQRDRKQDGGGYRMLWVMMIKVKIIIQLLLFFWFWCYNTNAFPYRLDYKAEFRALYAEVHSQCRWIAKSLTVNH